MRNTPVLLGGLHRASWDLRTRDALLGTMVFISAFAVYLPTLSPSVAPGDSGELQMLSSVLGIAHPTGYPLLLLLNWLFAHLPLGGDLAFRVTLLGALMTAGSTAVLYFLLRELRAKPIAALAAAWLVAAAPRVWMHAAAAEVYPFAELLIILGLWLLVRWGAGRAPLWAPMLVFGLGLSHHVSVRLFGPGVLAYLLMVDRRLLLRPRIWLPALVALVAPFGIYVYLPLRFAYLEKLPAYAGSVLGIPKLIASGLVSPHYYSGGAVGLFLASTYSQGFLHGGLSIGAAAVNQFREMALDQFPLVAAPFMILGLVVLLRRQWKVSVLLLLGAAVILAAALRFLTMYGEDGDHFIPVYVILSLCFGIGASAALDWLKRHLTRPRWARWLLAAVILAAPVYSAVSHFPAMAASHRTATRPTVLSSDLPSGAVLAGDWHDITPLLYEQRIEGIRPDLWVLHADAPGGRLLAHRAIGEDVPFYYLRPILGGLRVLPIPVRDVSVITRPTPGEGIQMMPSLRWRGYDLDPTTARRGDLVNITLYWQVDDRVEGQWMTFIHLVDADDVPVAQVDREPIGPVFPLSEWHDGLLLADQYELHLPADLAPGRYRLLFGWYQEGKRLTWQDGRDTHLLAEIEVQTQ